MSRSSAEKVGLLEGLLARVQRNAVLPRTHVVMASIPEGRPTATAPTEDELEMVGEADELAPVSGEVIAAATAEPAAHTTPSAGLVAPVELSAADELSASDELPAGDELEPVEELSPEDEVVAEETLPQPVEPPAVSRMEEPAPEPPPSEPVLEAVEELHEEDEVASERKIEKRSDSIEIAVQTAAAAVAKAPAEPLEADVIRTPAPPPERPSDAQLGAIIELEEGPAAAIELAPSQPVVVLPPADDEEVLPAAQSPGQFAPEMVHSSRPQAVTPARASSAPPPAPVAEIAAVALAVPPSPSPAPVPSAMAAPAAVAIAVEAQAVARQVLRGDVATFIAATRKPAAATFGELLDDALGL